MICVALTETGQCLLVYNMLDIAKLIVILCVFEKMRKGEDFILCNWV